MKITQKEFDVAAKTIRKILRRYPPKYEKYILLDALKIINKQTIDPKMQAAVQRAIREDELRKSTK